MNQQPLIANLFYLVWCKLVQISGGGSLQAAGEGPGLRGLQWQFPSQTGLSLHISHRNSTAILLDKNK